MSAVVQGDLKNADINLGCGQMLGTNLRRCKQDLALREVRQLSSDEDLGIKSFVYDGKVTWSAVYRELQAGELVWVELGDETVARQRLVEAEECLGSILPQHASRSACFLEE
jgi:hypothetical protein